MISSPGGDPGFLSVSATSPLFFSGFQKSELRAQFFSVKENIIFDCPNNQNDAMKRLYNGPENSVLIRCRKTLQDFLPFAGNAYPRFFFLGILHERRILGESRINLMGQYFFEKKLRECRRKGVLYRSHSLYKSCMPDTKRPECRLPKWELKCKEFIQGNILFCGQWFDLLWFGYIQKTISP